MCPARNHWILSLASIKLITLVNRALFQSLCHFLATFALEFCAASKATDQFTRSDKEKGVLFVTRDRPTPRAAADTRGGTPPRPPTLERKWIGTFSVASDCSIKVSMQRNQKSEGRRKPLSLMNFLSLISWEGVARQVERFWDFFSFPALIAKGNNAEKGDATSLLPDIA